MVHIFLFFVGPKNKRTSTPVIWNDWGEAQKKETIIPKKKLKFAKIKLIYTLTICRLINYFDDSTIQGQ